ncbi:penicillin-binding protein [Candidatus Uhrbacteria bacterium]|nr:penicillin-binding protein [Candidatus Uhrbacteria bacterium]
MQIPKNSSWKTHRTRRIPRLSWRPRISKTLLKNLFLLVVVFGLLGSIAVLGLFAYVSRDLPDPNTLRDQKVQQTTKIYDRTGEHLLYEIFGNENRTLVKLKEGVCNKDAALEKDPNGIPVFLLQATITAEDRNFCKHHGFVLKSFGRAILANLKGERQGASTITQQLVKNAILSNEKTLLRKVKELILSIELERRYEKDEILQIYFNEIPFGSTNYGVQAASLGYFHKNVNELTLAQAATLSALPQRPTTLLNNPDTLKERRDWILDGMVEMGFVSQEDADAAKATDTPVEIQTYNLVAPHFVEFVKLLLIDQLGYGQRDVEEGGLKVITSLDYDKQIIAETAVKAGVEANGKDGGFNNASLVAIEPKTGHILAFVGSADYWNKEILGMNNMALRPRQPGSSFKPLVYAKGFDAGYTPNTVLWDVKTNFPSASGNYSPNDYDMRERGPVRIRRALQNSLNIPAVEMLYLVGIEPVLSFARSMDYSLADDVNQYGLSFALGSKEIPLLDHTGGYATFANDGVYIPPVAILRVENPTGEKLFEWQPAEGKRVLEENASLLLTNVLSDNGARAEIFGSNSPLQLGNRPVAAKTGTTNDIKDAWTMGYTPQLAAGVWAGNANAVAMTRGGGTKAAAPIWHEFMSKALEGEPIIPFKQPRFPVTNKAVLDGKLASTTVVVDKISGKLATEFTPDSTKEERTYSQYHSILYYVDRSNPLGPEPTKPETDPYFRPWEEAVAAWITKEEERTGILISQGAAPTEFDDIHTQTNIPSVQIISPVQDAEFADRQIEIAAEASAVRGVSKVEFLIDGFYLGTDSRPPYIWQGTLSSTVSRGYHTIKAVAYDDADNSASSSIGIRISSTTPSFRFEISDPHNGQIIERTSDTFTPVISIDDPGQYSEVRLFSESVRDHASILIGTIANPSSPFLPFTWNLPAEPGEWILKARAERISGDIIDAPSILVKISAPAEPTTADTTLVQETTDLNPFAQ